MIIPNLGSGVTDLVVAFTHEYDVIYAQLVRALFNDETIQKKCTREGAMEHGLCQFYRLWGALP